MDLFTNGLGNFGACTAIGTEFGDAFDFVLKHWNPAQLGINAASNFFTHIFEILGDAWSLITDIFSLNMYKLGYDTGALTITLIN